MSDLIVATKIPGAAVYGVEQMSYTVDGVSGKDYMAALSAASFKEAVAIEQALSAYSEVVRQRMRKLEDLGDVMAVLNTAYATLKTKDMESDDKTSGLSELQTARNTAAKYGITLTLTDGNKMTRRNLMNAQNTVQYATDREDNDLKQDMVSLNSYISKRDNSYSTATKLVKKGLHAAEGTIGNIG
ncbi:MAG: hypothetical protein IJQ34_04230 [Kiritimatiellae bacterium]|nr:hypothetical protein [Kiritimatiellia bacterium]